MTKLELAKIGISTVVGFGASTIVRSICLNNTPADTIPNKVMVHSGAIVLGMMVSDLTRKYTDARIDEVVNWYNENVKK